MHVEFRSKLKPGQVCYSSFWDILAVEYVFVGHFLIEIKDMYLSYLPFVADILYESDK
jgi:hypothetical protein